MSLLDGLGGGLLTDLVGSYVDTVLLKSKRNFAGIYPDVVIEELHNDELEITSHPIEDGAAISDHAFKKPAELIMHVAWSSSKPLLNSIIADVQGVLNGKAFVKPLADMKSVYASLQQLQEKRNPFTVITGKRKYDNMLLRRLQITTNKDSENSLEAELHFQEVLIVSTRETTIPVVSSQLVPEKTADPVNAGTVQPKQTSQRINWLTSNPF